jgi:2-C-methyl-D-erythritol 2,4-cyclodiphosphate synthase
MARTRTGLGFDIHRFKKGRRLVLGGVEIPRRRGLDGHSDADVLLHAVMDALLGAIADGDIGEHFSNQDPRWKNADSMDLLRLVMLRLAAGGARVVNIDAVIIAEEPKVMPYSLPMRQNMADAIGIDVGDVSVKATTAETMGAIGRREGIAVMAVATVEVRARRTTRSIRRKTR